MLSRCGGSGDGNRYSPLAMKNKRHAFYAGGFIITTLVLTLGIILYVTGLGGLLGDATTHVARFTLAEGVSGLTEGATVRLGGVDVGNIKAVEVIADGAGEPHVEVRFTLPGRYTLRKDAAVEVGTQLTGDAYLAVTALGMGEPLGAGEAVRGERSDLEALLADLRETAPTAQRAVVQLAVEVLPELRDSLAEVKRTTMELREVAAATKGLVAEAGEAVQENRSDVRVAVEGMRDLADLGKRRLPDTLDRLDATLENAKMLTAAGERTLAEVDRLIADAGGISEAVRVFLVENRPKLTSAVTSLKRSGVEAEAAISELRRSPWRLLHKPGENELQNQDLFAAARRFAEGARDLSEAAASLEAASGEVPLGTAEVQRLLDELRASFERFDVVEEELYRRAAP